MMAVVVVVVVVEVVVVVFNYHTHACVCIIHSNLRLLILADGNKPVTLETARGVLISLGK